MSKTNPEAKHTFYISPLSQTYCFTCPLDDCVGEYRAACPIYQARANAKRKRTPPPAPSSSPVWATSPN